jgi:hypothetical protein
MEYSCKYLHDDDGIVDPDGLEVVLRDIEECKGPRGGYDFPPIEYGWFGYVPIIDSLLNTPQSR